jgi:tetratricopeptide (TPR) repeat protein
MRIRFIFVSLCGLLECLAQGPPSDNQIRFYQWRIQRDPTEYAGYDHLGSAYLQKARESGDPIYYGLSEKAYRRAQSLLSPGDPDSAGLIAHLAALYLSEHRFQEAIDLSQKALQLNPELITVNATLGDAQLETGKYEAAAATYALLKTGDAISPRPGLRYLAETRQAGLAYIQGNPTEAIAHMQAAVPLARQAGLAKENIAWTQFSLGELYFGTGDLDHAEQAYQAALLSYPNYHRALAWLGQLRAAQGKCAEAAELYRKALAVIPLPVYAAALGDIYSKLGEKDKAQKQYALVDVIARLSELNQQLFRRELAIFWADHDMRLKDALDFAQQELKLRQDVFTWDVLSWAQFKNGKITEAAQSIEHSLAIGTQDPLIFFHAGMIYSKLPDAPKAAKFLHRALAINPHFHIFYAETAVRTLEGLQ